MTKIYISKHDYSTYGFNAYSSWTTKCIDYYMELKKANVAVTYHFYRPKLEKIPNIVHFTVELATGIDEETFRILYGQ